MPTIFDIMTDFDIMILAVTSADFDIMILAVGLGGMAETHLRNPQWREGMRKLVTPSGEISVTPTPSSASIAARIFA
jgi:hypothetical protein